jgi:cellobiose transport system permease protein
MFVVASNGTEAMSQVPPAVVPGGRFFENAGNVFDNVQFLPALLNSFVVAGAIAVSVVFFATLAGFAFAKLRFRGRGALFIVVIATMMVPVQLGIIPLYMIMVRLGWTNQLQAVIVPMMVTAFGVFWMRQFISGALPTDLLDAGRVDGCSTFGLFRHIVIPSVRPAAAVLGLFTFMQAWNDFFWPLIVLRDPSKFTVQIALQQLNNAYYQDYGMVMAGTALAVLPVIALFVILGRHIVGGLMEGALKG